MDRHQRSETPYRRDERERRAQGAKRAQDSQRLCAQLLPKVVCCQRGQMRRPHRDEARAQRRALQRDRVDRGPEQVHGQVTVFVTVGVVGHVGVGVGFCVRAADRGALTVAAPHVLAPSTERAGTGTRSCSASSAERINANRVLQHVGDIGTRRDAELARSGEATQRVNQIATRGGRHQLVLMEPTGLARMRVLHECVIGQ